MAFLGVNKQDLQRLLALHATNGNVFNGSDTYIIDGKFYNYVSGSNSMVEVEPNAPFPVRWNPFTNLFEAEGYEPPVSPDTATGWADYADTQYTSGSPLSVLADTDTLLPNNGLAGVKTQEPADGPFYADGKITGREGDGLLITVDFKVTPTNANTTLLEVWFDVGGPVGELYRRPITFPKGNGVELGVNFTVSGYTLDTWEANGAEVYVRANGTCEIHSIRYVLTRTHKAVLE